jgi:phytoene/squalene synthetase
MTTGQLSCSYIGRLDSGTIANQPILELAARCWDADRYEAFRVCYRSMRWIDDLVDHQKAATPRIIKSKIVQIERTIASWMNAIRTRDFFDSSQKELAEVLHEFKIPLDPWRRFLKSMLYDLRHDGFASMLTFLRYCNGAAIAPASIFMHLCGIRKDERGYRPPEYDSREAARPLALFSYLVHIIRDFQKDHLNNLNYFP